MKKLFNWFRIWFQNSFPKKSRKIKVPIIYYYKLNLNNRYYTPENLSLELINSKIKRIGFLSGQIGYPNDPSTSSIIKMSHIFDKFYIEDNILWGEGRTLKTWEGQKLNWLLISGQVVFRPRSSGVVLENGEVQVSNIFAVDAILKKDDSFALQVERDEI
jgi:hypothetical protein